MIKKLSLLTLIPAALMLGGTAWAEPSTDRPTAEQGRYLAQIGGCNDCHTPGYLQNEGKAPEKDWLVGTNLGFRGPWGTTYPINLRLMMQALSEDEWLKQARSQARPPMPWFNLSRMTERDLRSIYLYVRGLGPAGEPAPQFVPPEQAVTTPYIDFVPRNLPTQAAAE